MAKSSRYQKVSEQTQDEAIKVAKATQRPGQTKEQTKLIAQGIEKGIDHFKKQQKSKTRELNKKLNKVSLKLSSADQKPELASSPQVVYKQSFLAWILLVVSWLGFAAYFLKVD
ncbi:MAG: DUF2956 domain-containing protein [Methylococcales bacterium]|nr:DUF2956 domain-containing protein [Methylococcales bacterium]